MKNIYLLPEPTAPEDWECCQSECGDSCVFAVYRREKMAYDSQQEQLRQQKEND